MNVVRENKFLDFDAFLQQPPLQIDCLMKVHCSVIIAMDEQDW